MFRIGRTADFCDELDCHAVLTEGTFGLPTKGSEVGKYKRGKGKKFMVLADDQGVPLGLELASASPHKRTLIESTIAQVVTVTPCEGWRDSKRTDLP